MTDNKQTNVSPCIEADCRQHCGTFRAAKVSEIWVSLVQQQPLRGTFIPPALSDLNAVASEQATGNWQLATGNGPAAIGMHKNQKLWRLNILKYCCMTRPQSTVFAFALALSSFSALSLTSIAASYKVHYRLYILQFLLWSISMEIASV